MRGLNPVTVEIVWKAAAVLLGRFASVQVLGVLEGQQIGLLLLQLPLELLGLALLLQLPPLILLRAGRIKLNQNGPERLPSERFIFTTQRARIAEAGSRLWCCRRIVPDGAPGYDFIRPVVCLDVTQGLHD